jgi:hypothetical protein
LSVAWRRNDRLGTPEDETPVDPHAGAAVGTPAFMSPEQAAAVEPRVSQDLPALTDWGINLKCRRSHFIQNVCAGAFMSNPNLVDITSENWDREVKYGTTPVMVDFYSPT